MLFGFIKVWTWSGKVKFSMCELEWRFGERDSSVVTAPDSWSRGPGFESPQERRENFLLQGHLSVLTLISMSVPPLVKDPGHLCQMYRWQVTARHTCTLSKWLWKKWHCKLVRSCKLCIELVPRRQQLYVAPAMQQPNSAIGKYTTSVDIKKTRYKRIQSLFQNHMRHECSEFLHGSRE